MRIKFTAPSPSTVRTSDWRGHPRSSGMGRVAQGDAYGCRHTRAIVAKIAAVSVLACIAVPSAVVSTAGAAPAMVRLGRLTPSHLPKGATRVGALSESKAIDLELVLASSHQAQLTSLLDALNAVGSPHYHHWLTPTEFAQRFGPTPTAVSAAESWLANVGLHVTSRTGFAVHVTGSVRAIESGLGVSLNNYRLTRGEEVHLPNRAPLVPAALSNSLISVLGLDNAPQLATNIVQGHSTQSTRLLPHAEGLSPCGGATSEASGVGGYTPDQVGAAYGIGSLTSAGQTGSGQVVAVYELAQHVPSDTNAYETCFGLHNPVTTVNVDGGGTAGTEGTAEADADIEQVATQAPGASIISYEGPNTPMGDFDTWNTIVTQNTASVVSTSFGLCEPDSSSDGVVSSVDALLEQAAAQGQTVLTASGDSGSEDCYTPSGNTDSSLQVDYPSSDPFVTAVGGTTLAGNGSQTAWNTCEGQTGTTCANGGGGAGGGGISRLWDRPSWQPPAWEWATSGNACAMNCRDLPDVSANAGAPEVFFVAGVWNAFLGTSIAAPLVAGLVADTANGCSSARRGDIAPALYELAGQGVYGTALSDVSTGDNDFTRTNSPSEYPTAAGYDPATGLGTPLASGWSCPEVSSVSPTEAQPGAEVTVGGLGLEKATISFGGRGGTVVSATATTATVVVPSGGGTVTVTAADAIGAGTSAGSFTFPVSSTPSPATSSGYDLVGKDGGVFVFPTNQSGGFYGSLPGLGVHVHDITGMVPSPDDKGYFLVGQDGGVFAFGDAPFLGSLPGLRVKVSDIRGIVPTRDNRGYFLVGRDGGVFAFGDAPFLGSLPGEGVHITTVVGIAATPSDQGYWVVAGNGAVYAFGNAPNFGSAVGTASPVSGIASTPDGGGYWIVTQNGSVSKFGDAGYFGALPALGVRPTSPVIGLVPTADDQGYWLIGSDGGIFAFGDAPFVGSLPALGVHITDVVGAVPTTSVTG
jgi:hypothetical protein